MNYIKVTTGVDGWETDRRISFASFQEAKDKFDELVKKLSVMHLSRGSYASIRLYDRSGNLEKPFIKRG